MSVTSAYADFVANSLRDQPFAFGNIWVGLYTASPGWTGDQAFEVKLSDYSRVQVTFGPASSGVVSSDSDVTFGPAVSNWGSVPYVALHSAQTGGIVLAYQTFFDTSSNVVSVKAGDTLTFTAGNLKFSIS